MRFSLFWILLQVVGFSPNLLHSSKWSHYGHALFLPEICFRTTVDKNCAVENKKMPETLIHSVLRAMVERYNSTNVFAIDTCAIPIIKLPCIYSVNRPGPPKKPKGEDQAWHPPDHVDGYQSLSNCDDKICKWWLCWLPGILLHTLIY